MDLEKISVRVALGASLFQIAARLIEAAKVDDLVAANPDLADDIRKLSDEDPSKKGKYLEWSVKQLKMKAKMEDLIPTIEAFHGNQQRMQKKDINQYKTLKELEDAVKVLPESKTKERARVKSEGSKKLWENDTHALFRIETRDACIQYGKGTKWCITMKSHNYWENYKSGNTTFYFLIDKRQSEPEKENESFAEAREKNNPGQYSKIAWAVKRNFDDNSVTDVTIFDANDKQIKKQSVPGIPEFGQLHQMVLEDAPSAPDGPLVSMKKGKITPEELYDYLSSLDRQGLMANVGHISPKKELDSAILRIVRQKQDKLSNEDIAHILQRLDGSSPEIDEALLGFARQGVKVDLNDFRSGPEFDEALRLRLEQEPNYLNVHENVKYVSKVSDTKYREGLAEQYKGRMAEVGIIKDQETLEKLLRDGDPKVRASVVKGLVKQPEMLKSALHLADDPDSSVREALAQVPGWVWDRSKVPAEQLHEVLNKLLHDEDASVVRSAVRGDISKLDQEVLKKLSRHPDEKVRANFHDNPNVGEDLKPTNDESEHVRRSIVRNRKLSPETLDQMAKSSDVNERRLALNFVKERGYGVDKYSGAGRKACRDFASRLVKDEDPQVRALANSIMMHNGGKYNTEGFEKSLDSEDVMAWIGHDLERAQSVLKAEKGAMDEYRFRDVQSRAQLVITANELMDYLSGKSDVMPKLEGGISGLSYVAKLLPTEYLEKLLEKLPIPEVQTYGVWEVLAEKLDKKHALEILNKMPNPAEAPTAVTALFKKLSQPDIQKFIDSDSSIIRQAVARRIDKERLPEMIDDANNEVRRIVAEKIDPAQLPRMMKDQDPKVRRRVAERIAPEHLEQMRKDKSIRVRDVVKQRLGLASSGLGSLALLRIACSVAFPGGLEPPFAG